MILKNIIPFVHEALAACIRPGDTVVDATAGNGHDTLFLASSVGDEGKVFAFDIQEQALKATAARLTKAHLAHRVCLLKCGHETVTEYVPPGIRAALFNCGYLPGGDKGLSTEADNTVSGLAGCLKLLQPGGVAACVLYPGHEAGQVEADAVLSYTSGLSQQHYDVLVYRFGNRSNHPPFAVLFEKIRS